MAGTAIEMEEERIALDRGDKGLGFNIKGGIDQPHISSNEGIFVTKIRDDGAAAVDGRLKRGDRILEINGTDVRNVQHSQAVDLFLSAGDEVVLVVQHGAEEAAAAQEEEEEEQKDDPDKTDPADNTDKSNRRTMLILGSILAVVLIITIYVRKTK